MAGIDAPYLTPDQLTGQPGDANLAGVEINFDPSVKNPLAPMQQTADRVFSEQNQAIQQRAQQQRQQKHDLLTRQMEYDQQNSVLRQQHAWQNQKDLYGMFKNTGMTSHTIPGPDGKPMNIPYRAEDQAVVDKLAHEIRDRTLNKADNYMYSSDFDDSMSKFEGLNTNASLRAIQTAQAKQELAGAYLPEQKQAIQDYIAKIEATPLDEKTPPAPYVSQASWSANPQVDTKAYDDPKKLESFNGQIGIPNRVYAGFETTTNPAQLNQGFGNFQHFLSNPEGQDPIAYAAYQKEVNDLRRSRGLEPIDLGGQLDRTGKLTFDTSTPKKRTEIARKFLTSYNLMQTGHLQDDPSAEKDQLDLDYKKAQIEDLKAKRDIDRKEFELKRNKDTREAAEASEDEYAAASTVNTVANTFNSEREKKNFHPLSDVPNVQPAITALGVNAKNYEVAALNHLDNNIKDISGVQTQTLTGALGKAASAPSAAFYLKSKNGVQDDRIVIGIPMKSNEEDKKGNKVTVTEMEWIAVSPEDAVKNKISTMKNFNVTDKTLASIGKAQEAVNKMLGTTTSAKQEPAKSPAKQGEEQVITARLVPAKVKTRDGRVVEIMYDPVTKKRYAK